MRVERSEPILLSRDLDETRAFYERLGFEPWFRGRGGWAYEILSRGHLVVHFVHDPALDPATNQSGCYWRVRDADALHRLSGALGVGSVGIPRVTEIADRHWGMREFSIVDPSGNLVRVGHDLGDAYVAPEG